MSHKHCVFCGEELPVPRPTSFVDICYSPANTTTPDTVGNRHHAYFIGRAVDHPKQPAPASPPEKVSQSGKSPESEIFLPAPAVQPPVTPNTCQKWDGGLQPNGTVYDDATLIEIQRGEIAKLVARCNELQEASAPSPVEGVREWALDYFREHPLKEYEVDDVAKMLEAYASSERQRLEKRIKELENGDPDGQLLQTTCWNGKRHEHFDGCIYCHVEKLTGLLRESLGYVPEALYASIRAALTSGEDHHG